LKTNTWFLSFNFKVFQFKRFDILSPRSISERISDHEILYQSSLYAPLNGRIVKINNYKGDKIESGDAVLIIESMKMENEIRIPYNCFIKQVIVKEGERVTEGDLLLELDFESK
jgi:biotin carboxyl carrier protein